MMAIGGKAWLVAALLILSLAAMPPRCPARLNPQDAETSGRDIQRTKQILQLLNDQAHRLGYMNTPIQAYSSGHHKSHRRKSRSSRKSKSSRASQTSAVNQLLSGLSRSSRMTATRGFGDFTVSSRPAFLPTSDDAFFTAPATLHVRKGVSTLTDSIVESSGALKSVSTSLVNVMGNLLDEHPNLALDKSADVTDSLSKGDVMEDQAESGATTVVAAAEDQDGELGPISEENGFAPLVEDDTANAEPSIPEESGFAPPIEDDTANTEPAISEENGFAPLIEGDTANAEPGNLDTPSKLVDERTEEEP